MKRKVEGEPQENSPEPEKDREDAEFLLGLLSHAIYDAEYDKKTNREKDWVDLSGFSSFLEDQTKEEALRTGISEVKARLNFLDDKKRKVAEDLILKGELYLADYSAKFEK